MTDKIRKKLQKTTTDEEFFEFLKKYYPNYFNKKMDKWDKEIYEHLVIKILRVSIEEFEKGNEFYF